MNEPPAVQSAESIASRALVLGAFVLRGLLEQNYQTDSHVLARRTSRTGMRGLKVWMEIANLIDHQSPDEKTHFDSAPGSWQAEAISLASWQVEALGVLLWALNRVEALPGYDTLFDSGVLLEHIPFYDDVEEFMGHTLRPSKDLQAARDSAELWHWRVRTTRLQDQGFQSNEGIDLDDLIAERARLGRQTDLLPPLIDDDFPAFGTSFARLEPAQFEQIAGTARVRHRTFNWICGLGSNWDTISTNT